MKDVDPHALGRRIASRRAKLGFSQNELAKHVGMQQQGVDAIEQGRVKRPRLLKELASALRTSEDWLLWRKGTEERGDERAHASHERREQNRNEVSRNEQHRSEALRSEALRNEPRRVPAGEEFDPDPDGERPVTELDRPFPDALPQMAGRIGGGSTGVVITINAGEMHAREEVGDWWRIPPTVMRGLARADLGKTVAFVMDGDSMEPTIQRTDIVFVDTSRQKIEPDGIWAVDYGLGRTLKRVAVERTDGQGGGQRGGQVRYVLKSDNMMYPDQSFAPEEVTVFGRYVGRFSVF
jgi:transcriptional regulator with XRE-family HTH domain